ncbi:MAG: hypothetical protein CTY37_00095 [Methylotenera sp.]|nr:MAG: hypothetical protein CTY37_00095 [Methylotenera sp.]
MLHPWFKLLGLKSSFFNEWCLFIQPQRILLLQLNRPIKHGLKSMVVHKQVIELPLEVGVSAEVKQQVIIQALVQALASVQYKGAVVSVVLSNHFARYAIIPWNAGLTDEHERQAFMQHCFSQAYGEPAKAWNLRMNSPDFGKNTIASAIAQSFLQDLHGICADAGVTLIAVHPHLMLAVNQTLSAVKKHHQEASFWLVVVQSGQLCLAFVERGDWRLVKTVALNIDVSAEVGALIQREMVSGNVQENWPKFLYWPESSYTQSMTLGGFDMIKVLPHAFDMQSGQLSNLATSLAAA